MFAVHNNNEVGFQTLGMETSKLETSFNTRTQLITISVWCLVLSGDLYAHQALSALAAADKVEEAASLLRDVELEHGQLRYPRVSL